MIDIQIPGGGPLRLDHLVLDYNGTLAEDGELIHGVRDRLTQMADVLRVHVVTADTHGTVREKLRGLDCTLHIIADTEQDLAKQAYVRALQPSSVVAAGNGRNDVLMLREAALGIALIQAEGAHVPTLLHADLVCSHITAVFDLLLFPHRLIATLRN